ncbi:MAG: MCE family protein [Bacteroidales bacterium]|nr:MCE family protein [Bacteroidales bacterium]
MKIRKEFYLGFVATFTIVSAYFGYNFLRGKDLLDRTYNYYIIYDKIAGLSESNSVYLNGFKIGLVSGLDLLQSDGSNRVLVEIQVDKTVRIPKNSVAKIESDFLGVNTISILFSNNPDFAEDGDTLNSAIATTIQEEVSMQILPLKAKTENMLATLDTVLESIKYVFNEETQRSLANSFASIQKTINNIEHSSFTLDTVLTTQKGVISRILENVHSITSNLKNNNEQINRAIANFSNFSDSLAKIDLRKTIYAAEKALSDFQSISDKINRGEGSLGMLVNNDTLYHELEAASHELNKLVEDIKLNPQRYLHFSVFGRSPKRNVYVDPDSVK